ncbi:ATP-binding cassette domain-containing protein [Arhodomonas sp. AD133]|uniref:ATP-binding cassette domain-containing protein n=1 Tax=Arhodomonas sp. AD133 TaxID=3415009 RepID=UPI003EBDA69C
MTPEPSALEAVGLSKAYGDRQVLCGLDMTVAAGEVVVLLGPNGAGKTTLFQLLTGLFAADAGLVVIAGADLRDDPNRALASMGIVFQQPALDLDLSVAANLRFAARLHEIAHTERAIRDALARVKLSADRRGAYACAGAEWRQPESGGVGVRHAFYGELDAVAAAAVVGAVLAVSFIMAVLGYDPQRGLVRAS